MPRIRWADNETVMAYAMMRLIIGLTSQHKLDFWKHTGTRQNFQEYIDRVNGEEPCYLAYCKRRVDPNSEHRIPYDEKEQVRKLVFNLLGDLLEDEGDVSVGIDGHARAAIITLMKFSSVMFPGQPREVYAYVHVLLEESTRKLSLQDILFCLNTTRPRVPEGAINQDWIRQVNEGEDKAAPHAPSPLEAPHELLSIVGLLTFRLELRWPDEDQDD